MSEGQNAMILSLIFPVPANIPFGGKKQIIVFSRIQDALFFPIFTAPKLRCVLHSNAKSMVNLLYFMLPSPKLVPFCEKKNSTQVSPPH